MTEIATKTSGAGRRDAQAATSASAAKIASCTSVAGVIPKSCSSARASLTKSTTHSTKAQSAAPNPTRRAEVKRTRTTDEGLTMLPSFDLLLTHGNSGGLHHSFGPATQVLRGELSAGGVYVLAPARPRRPAPDGRRTRPSFRGSLVRRVGTRRLSSPRDYTGEVKHACFAAFSTPPFQGWLVSFSAKRRS